MRPNFHAPALLLASVVLIAAAPAKLAMKSLKVTAPAGWSGDYNDAIDGWDYYKYIDVKGETLRKGSKVYIDLLPDDAPTTMKAYADKLKVKDFQDMTYVYTEITEQSAIEGGFLIRGLQLDTADKAAKPTPNFVVVKKIGGVFVRARSGTMANADMLKEAIDLAKSMSI